MGSPTASPSKAAATINTTTIPNAKTHDLEKSADHMEVSSQWLRAAVRGANEGVLSTAALMVGVRAVKGNFHTTLIESVSCLLGDAFCMAAGEFVSVYSQYDIEFAQLDRERENHHIQTNHTAASPKVFNSENGGSPAAPVDMVEEEYLIKKKDLPSPFKAAGASALAFAMGALVPLLMFLAVAKKAYGVRIGVVIAAASVALGVFGWVGAVLGKSPPMRAAVRVLIGGWVAMGVTFGLTKLVGASASGI